MSEYGRYFAKYITSIQRTGKLIILTSHHQEDIMSVCNQVIHLQDGCILTDRQKYHKDNAASR